MLFLNRWFIGFVLLLNVGCSYATYFKVTDPVTSKVYYTRYLENVKGGSINFKDAQTGNSLTLESSRVEEISSKEYQRGYAAISPLK